MQLEVGGNYRTRNGDIVSLVRSYSNGSFLGKVISAGSDYEDSFWTYLPNGDWKYKLNEGKPHYIDIVECCDQDYGIES